METIIAPAFTALVFEGKTTLKNLQQYTGNYATQIVREAVNNGFHPTGPQYWVYVWNSMDMESEFDLKICLPVATFGNKYNGNALFKLQKIEAFKHVAVKHTGPWHEMANTYSKLYCDMQSQKIQPTNVCREVYINCDFENPENNITEIQYGIA